jgi:hypothetical protein
MKSVVGGKDPSLRDGAKTLFQNLSDGGKTARKRAG